MLDLIFSDSDHSVYGALLFSTKCFMICYRAASLLLQLNEPTIFIDKDYGSVPFESPDDRRGDRIDRKNLANQISHDYTGKELILVCILKGAFMFLSDLVRHLEIPVKIDFVRLASYGSE
jgi:hypothetical protein